MILVQDKNGIYRTDELIKDISYPEEGNNIFYDFENKSIWFNLRNELISKLIRKYSIKGDFLDIGGGNGFQLSKIKNLNVFSKIILCEPGYQGCLNARKRNIEYVYNLRFQTFPFKDFDIQAIGLFDVIEHLENDVDFLNQLYDYLPIGAKVYITVPSMKMLWAEIDSLSGHHRRYNKKDIARLKRGIRFKLLDSGYFFSLFFLPLFFFRVIPYVFGVRKGEAEIFSSEVKNHTNENKLVKFVMNFFYFINIWCFKRSIKSLFGSSLYIVLEK
ncbi:MAG: hypothetical protein WCK02_09005 [Bacteroidota bacterium]